MKIKLNEITELQKKIQSNQPLEESLSHVIRDLEKRLRYQSLGIFLKVPRTDLFRLKISRNISHHFAKDTIFTMSDPLMERLSKRETIAVDEVGFYKFEHYFQHLIVSPIFYENNLIGFLFVDRAENKFSQDELEQIDFYSSLIGTIIKINILEDDIINHQGIYDTKMVFEFKPFIHKANNSLTIMKRYNRDFSLAVFTIDNYKNLVRSNGEVYMKKIRKEIGFLIKNSLRTTDIVGNIHDKVFVIALPETSLKKAILTIERIEKNLSPIIQDNNISRGWGATEANDDVNTMIELMKRSESNANEAVRQEKIIYY